MCSSVHLHGGAFCPPFPSPPHPKDPQGFSCRSKATLNHLTCALSASGGLLERSSKLWRNAASTKGCLAFSTNTMLLGQFKQIYTLLSVFAIHSCAFCYSWNVTTLSRGLLNNSDVMFLPIPLLFVSLTMGLDWIKAKQRPGFDEKTKLTGCLLSWFSHLLRTGMRTTQTEKSHVVRFSHRLKDI